jgi:hypothetical protein
MELNLNCFGGVTPETKILDVNVSVAESAQALSLDLDNVARHLHAGNGKSPLRRVPANSSDERPDWAGSLGRAATL